MHLWLQPWYIGRALAFTTGYTHGMLEGHAHTSGYIMVCCGCVCCIHTSGYTHGMLGGHAHTYGMLRGDCARTDGMLGGSYMHPWIQPWYTGGACTHHWLHPWYDGGSCTHPWLHPWYAGGFLHTPLAIPMVCWLCMSTLLYHCFCDGRYLTICHVLVCPLLDHSSHYGR